MNLSRLAAQAAERGTPVRAGLIGAGKFGSMFLSQVPSINGLEVSAIADLNPDRARAACRDVGWDDTQSAATAFLDDGAELARRDDVDVVIEATGNPRAGIAHARAAIQAGKHVIMVNVEADVLAGAILAREAEAAGVVYSMAYGDQPALVSEMVDWARAAGFSVTAAGKGTKYLPAYHNVTPDDVWSHYGLTPQAAADAGMNPQMFNSFLDGTKSAIEMVAIANACARSPVWLKRSRRWSVTVVRFSAISVGVSMSCSKPPTTMRRHAFGSTGCQPMKAVGTPRCTSPSTLSGWSYPYQY